MFNGRGSIVYDDSSKYDGNFSNGKYDGFGTEEWPDLRRYEGYYKDD